MIRLELCRDQPIHEHVDLLRDLVAYLRSAEGAEVDTARLVVGTDFVSYPAAVRRMIDHARTKPFKPHARGGIHAYIVAAATERDLFPELVTIFSPRKPVLVSAEGCSYGSTASRDYGGDWLRSEKIDGYNLPLGCLSSVFELRES